MSPVLTAARFHSNSQLCTEKLNCLYFPLSLSDISGHPEQLWGWLGMGQCATKTDSTNTTTSPPGKLARSRSFAVTSLSSPQTSVMDGDDPEDYYSDDFDEDEDDPIECSSDNDDVYMESHAVSPFQQGSPAMEAMPSYSYLENDSPRWLKL